MEPDNIFKSCNDEENPGGEIDIENIPTRERKKGHKTNISVKDCQTHIWI